MFQSPYGEEVEPAKAPEAISKAVASLPPEQMYELMKQMKVFILSWDKSATVCFWQWLDITLVLFQLCIQNNPNEARNMLLQNPQLAYALLQAQIVMKIVDPKVALVSVWRYGSEYNSEYYNVRCLCFRPCYIDRQNRSLLY